MTDTHTPATPPTPARPPARSSRLPFFAYLTCTAGLLVWLIWPNAPLGTSQAASAAGPTTAVSVDHDGQITVDHTSPLRQKLTVTTVTRTRLTIPVLTVTGTVFASLRRDESGTRDWQFNSPELLAVYSDWQKAMTEIAFASTQIESTRQLATSRTAAQDAAVQRLVRLVEAGTNTEQDLAAARADLLQAQIEGRKTVHEAETQLRVAQRSAAALAGQLEQAGLDPVFLRQAAGEVDTVVADVPEALASRVSRGQGCEARFVGIADRVFSGTVQSLSPVLSQERRTLRVLFTIADPGNILRPGMFADIGLGTDARDALVAPLGGVVHIGRDDLMLVRSGPDRFRIARVQVGEAHGAAVEVLSGLTAGSEVIGDGAILLKPAMIEALAPTTDRGRQSQPPAVSGGAGRR